MRAHPIELILCPETRSTTEPTLGTVRVLSQPSLADCDGAEEGDYLEKGYNRQHRLGRVCEQLLPLNALIEFGVVVYP